MKKNKRIKIKDLIDSLGQPKEVDEVVYKRYQKRTLTEIYNILGKK